jgi:hypothetical protein
MSALAPVMMATGDRGERQRQRFGGDDPGDPPDDDDHRRVLAVLSYLRA